MNVVAAQQSGSSFFAGKFNQLVYQYPIRIPERFSLVIRSLLTQEGICLTLQPDFKFLEVRTSSLLGNIDCRLEWICKVIFVSKQTMWLSGLHQKVVEMLCPTFPRWTLAGRSLKCSILCLLVAGSISVCCEATFDRPRSSLEGTTRAGILLQVIFYNLVRE